MQRGEGEQGGESSSHHLRPASGQRNEVCSRRSRKYYSAAKKKELTVLGNLKNTTWAIDSSQRRVTPLL